MPDVKSTSLALVSALSLAAMTADPVAAAGRLVLSENGVPIPVGTEVRVELETEPCTWTVHGHVSVNNAHKDAITVGSQEAKCPFKSYLFSYSASGSASAIELSNAGQTTISGPLRIRGHEYGHGGCGYQYRKFAGSLAVPGSARLEGAARGKLVENEGYRSPCEKSHTVQFVAAVYGTNNKLVEVSRVR
jgi:hypothetical protein